MKKIIFLLFVSFALSGFIFADGIINLSPGWNVVSTPKLLSGISFSNSGNGIFFYVLSGSSWTSIVPNIQNIKPLEGFVVNNATTGDVTMALNYRSNISPMETLFQKTLNLGWNLLGITTIINPFTNITNAVMSVDFTKNVSSNFLNGINNNFTVNASSSNVDLLELGESYGIFVASSGSIYGGTQNHSNNGNITLIKSNPSSNYLTRNEEDLFLGSFTIQNNAAGNLILEDFDLAFTTGSSNTGIANIIKSVKVRVGNISAVPISLENYNNESVWSKGSLGATIGSGLTVYVYADIEDIDTINTQFVMTLSNVSIRDSVVDEFITNISPSALTYAIMKGSITELTLTNTTLAAKSVAKGAENVETISFKAKTSTGQVAISELIFAASGYGLTGVDLDTISGAVLYVGTGQYIAAIKNNTIVVDSNIVLGENTITTFALKINLVDTPQSHFFKYVLSGITVKNVLSGIDTSSIIGRTITVLESAELIIGYDPMVTNNKYAKSILAGTNTNISEYEVYAKYEYINVGEIAIQFNTGLQDSVNDIELYYDGILVATNPTWNGTTGIFTNLDFDISTMEKMFLVKLITKTIDVDGGITVKGAKVNSISFHDLQGVDSADIVGPVTLGVDSSLFDIVPATVFTSVSDVTATTAKLNLTVNRGNNTTSGNVSAKAIIEGLNFSVEGNNGGLQSFKIKDDSSVMFGEWNVAGDIVTMSGFFNSQILFAGTTTWTLYAVQSGSIDNPSYTLFLTGVDYMTNVDNIMLTDRTGVRRTIISK